MSSIIIIIIIIIIALKIIWEMNTVDSGQNEQRNPRTYTYIGS